MPLGRARMGRRGVVGTVARTAVVAGTATHVSNNVSRRQAARQQQSAESTAWEQQQQWAAQQAAAAPAPAAPAGTGDTIAQLKELAALKEQGILTDDEFAAQKAKILGA